MATAFLTLTALGLVGIDFNAGTLTQLGTKQYGIDPGDGTVNGYPNLMPIAEEKVNIRRQNGPTLGLGDLTTHFMSNQHLV